jgi:putative tryptophan/tyrosine transport system substrate-binding protein
MNSRRYLLGVLAFCLLSAALPTAAQLTEVWRIGFLAQRSRPTSWDIDYYGAFLKGLRDLGYVEGNNLVVEWRFADGLVDRLPALAAELVQLNVAAIVTAGTPAIRAAKQATSTIPIVMAYSVDPVGSGFVKSLDQPGGNITGTASIGTSLTSKHLALLTSVVPNLSVVALLLNPDSDSYTPILKGIYEAAQSTGIKVLRHEARNAAEIDNAFAAMAMEGAGAVMVGFDGFFVQQRHQIAGLAVKHRLPSLFAVREQVEAGGLMSYGQSFAELYRRAAMYVDKILKGAKPEELPIELSSQFELVINTKVARALEIAIPQSILSNAEKVAE